MKKISKEFSKPIEIDLQNGQELDNIKADYRLTVLKPLQGKQLIELNNQTSTEEDIEIVINGWKDQVYLIVYNMEQEVFNRQMHFTIFIHFRKTPVKLFPHLNYPLQSLWSVISSEKPAFDKNVSNSE